MSAVRVRFAPSPTGALHVGNARTALFNWLFARGRGGTLILRIEDTDVVRSSPEHEAALIADLAWLGLGWDEGLGEGGEAGPYRQSERLPIYRRRAEELMEAGFAYPCFCSLEVLEQERAAQRDAGRASLYSGRCRRLPRDEARRRMQAEPAALRFDVVAAAKGDPLVVFEDRVHDSVRFPVAQIGDFVLLRRAGWPSYNFAVVVDDLAMRITDVIRGDDHLSNTPRQILLYRALGATTLPAFAHLPLILGQGGAPLSKREGAASVGWFRAQGYPPEALTNYLALLGWSPASGQEFLTPEELIQAFDLGRASRAPAHFDRDKLDALAARHMARLPATRLADLAVRALAEVGFVAPGPPQEVSDWAGRLAMLFADRLPKMADLPGQAAFLFDFSAARSLADPGLAGELRQPRARAVVEALVRRLDDQPLTAPRFQAIADEIRRELGVKGRDLYHPIRIALTGAASGPELVKLLPIIEEGSRLRLAQPVAACAARARALLQAIPGTAT
jgi:glutamyl-tRNA synthetase